MLRSPLEPKQYTSITYTERLDDIGAAPSIGTVGDSFDNAMAESVMGIFKTELFRNPAALADNGGPWKGLDDLEIVTCAWVSWSRYAGDPPGVRAVRSGWLMWPSSRAWSTPAKVLAAV